jgi:hypothetical protein
MKNITIDKDRSAEGLGYAGIALVLLALFVYLFYPSYRESTWVMNLSFIIIGTFLVLLAVFFHFKK